MSVTTFSLATDLSATKSPLFKSQNYDINDSEIQPNHFSRRPFKFIIKKKEQSPVESPKDLRKYLKEDSIWECELDTQKLEGSPHFNMVLSEDFKDSNKKSKEPLHRDDEKESFSIHHHENNNNISVFSFGKTPRNTSSIKNSLELRGFQEIINNEKPMLPFIAVVNEADEINLNSGVLMVNNKPNHQKNTSRDTLEVIEPGESNETIAAGLSKTSTNEEIRKKPVKTKAKSQINLKKLTNLEDLKRVYTIHLNNLKKGKIFLKFGRKNIFGPTKRKICFNDEMNCFFWTSPKRNGCSFGNESFKKFYLKDINGILEGRKSLNFQRFKTNNEEKNQLSFSIVLSQRTVDLEALSMKEKEEFMTSFIKIMLLRKKMMLGESLGIKL